MMKKVATSEMFRPEGDRHFPSIWQHFRSMVRGGRDGLQEGLKMNPRQDGIGVDGQQALRRTRTILLVANLVLGLAVAPVPSAQAFDVGAPGQQPVHQEITRAALGDGSAMGDDALRRVIAAVVASDLHQLDPQRHFDNAPTPDVVCLRWKEGIDRWFREAVAFTVPKDDDKRELQDRKAALERFGWVAHAIQDFYSHSNYVELSQGGPVPPADRILLDECGPLPPGLQTGYFSLRYGPDGCPPLVGGPPRPPAPYRYCHSQLNKDNPSRPSYAEARAHAVTATKAAWVELHRRTIAKYGEDKTTDAECLFMKLAWGQDRSCRRY